MGQLWDLVEAYRRRHEPYPPSIREIAAQIAMSPTAVGNWRDGLSRVPERRNLLRFADLVGVSYQRVLDAALSDAKFLPESAAREEQERIDTEERAFARELAEFTERLLREAHGDAAAAVAALDRMRMEGEVVDARLLSNAQTHFMKLQGYRPLSVAPDNIPDAIAAHDEDVPIAGEQEESDLP